MGKACSTHRAKKNAHKVSGGKSKEKTSIGRPRHRWEDYIKIEV
jgi:hypothetical protein